MDRIYDVSTDDTLAVAKAAYGAKSRIAGSAGAVAFHSPPALLFSMIPISAGGWGLCEGGLIFALGSLGIPAEEAIVPSLVFGLGILLVTLPGALVWLANRKPDAPDDDIQSLMPAIGDDISGKLGSVKVGGAGDNVGGRSLS